MPDQFTIEVDGLKALGDRFMDLDKEGKKRVVRAVNLNAIEFHRGVVKSIEKNTGRYRQYKRGKNDYHYSSMPGRPPNSDMGGLKGKRFLRITRRASAVNQNAVIISDAPYSVALERGTRRMKARPFMAPMLRKKNKIFVSRIKQAIRGIL